jgi:hypothetical protein
MIEVVPLDGDDGEFIATVERIVNGAVTALDVHKAFLVHVDNWFDHKWLGFGWGERGGLVVPPFERNRILSETHFIQDGDRGGWAVANRERSLHLFHRDPSHRRRPFSSRKLGTIEEYSPAAAFIWFGGRSTVNRTGSLMLYLSGAGGYSWYASFIGKPQWSIHDAREITRRQLIAFEARGREMTVD